MSKSKLLRANGAFSVTHQAVCNTCNDDDYPPRTDIADAYTDAAKHIAKPGKSMHAVRVDTTQTSSRMFISPS